MESKRSNYDDGVSRSEATHEITSAPKVAIPQRSEEVRFDFQPSDGVNAVRPRINGQYVTVPMSLVDYKNILGEPTRSFHGINTVHTYDNLGVLVFETPGTGKVIQVCIVLNDEKRPFWPKKFFMGQITFMHLTPMAANITRTTRPKDLPYFTPSLIGGEIYDYKVTFDNLTVALNAPSNTDPITYITIEPPSVYHRQ